MSNTFAPGQSGNIAGRPKGTRYSVLTTKGRVQRFLNRTLTSANLSKLYNDLNAADKLKLIAELLPYVFSKQAATGLSDAELDELYNKIEASAKG